MGGQEGVKADLSIVPSLPLSLVCVQAEPKEDYSHLPPERQRKKLQSKVDDLEAAIGKTLSDKWVT